jgi:subtilisin family serine protease
MSARTSLLALGLFALAWSIAAPAEAAPTGQMQRIGVLEEPSLFQDAAVKRKRKLRKPRTSKDEPPKTTTGTVNQDLPKPGQSGPGKTVPQTTPDNQDKEPHRKKRKRNRIKLVARPLPRLATICIDGEPRGKSCRCPSKSKAVRVSKHVFRCAATGSAAAASLAAPAIVARGVERPEAAPPAIATPSDVFVRDEVLVTVASASPGATDAAIGARYGLQRLESREIALIDRRLVRYRIPDGRAVAAVLAAMGTDGQILSRQPNYYYRREDSAAEAQTQELQYALAKLDIPAAHALGQGRGALIAVIDSGINQAHRDLAGAVAEIFAAAPDTGGTPDNPHGTAIAGIAAARGLTQGVAPGAKLFDVRIFSRVKGRGEPRATTMSLLRGLDWSVSRGARIANMSIAGPEDPLARLAVEAAARNDVIMVAAAGNGGAYAAPAYPAAYDDVIAVTATDAGDGLFAMANRGAYVDFAAPGVDVLVPALGQSYAMKSGTSFAAAHVSGVIALLLSRDPERSTEDVRQALAAGAADLGAPGVDPEFGAGRVNALAALKTR